MKTTRLSKHSIVIRKRTSFETADLALCVLRDQWKAISFYFLLLMVPFYILNFFLCWPLYNNDYYFAEDFFEAFGGNVYYLFLLLMLTLSIEMHFVGSLVVVYLGHWIFDQKQQSYRIVFSDWFRAIPQSLFYLLLFSFYYIMYESVAEIILLEKTPFFKQKGKNVPTTGKRLRYFNKNLKGEKQQQVVLSIFCLLPMLILGLFICNILGSYLFPQEQLWQFLFVFVIIPLLYWGLALFFIVNEFLNYINLRIIQEGWDLDILFKQECFRLDHQNDLFLYQLKEKETDIQKEYDISDWQQDQYSSMDDIAIRPINIDIKNQNQDFSSRIESGNIIKASNDDLTESEEDRAFFQNEESSTEKTL